MTFREAAADHYRKRGYDVRQSVKVRGASGNIWAVDLVAQGSLGNLVVTFGGLDGPDEADVAQIRRIAKDVGASAVVATPSFEPEIRRAAQREGVAILDENMPAPEAIEGVAWPSQDDSLQLAKSDHPWPQTGVAQDPAKLALRSVALDDLLGDDDQEEPAPTPKAVEPTPEAKALWGKKQATDAPPENLPVNEQAARPTPDPADQSKSSTKFGWLKDPKLSHGGGYEFPDAKPASSAPPTHDAGLQRNAVLEDVRARVDRIQPRGDTSRIGKKKSRDGTARIVLLVILGAIVAGVVAWGLLRFGP